MNDTTHDADLKRTRRGRRNPGRPRSATCRREGCSRPVTTPDRGYCTGLCRLIDREQDRSQRICQAVGAGTESSELWSTIAMLGDSWSEYLRLEDRLKHVAHSVGIDETAWQAVKDGSSG